MMTNGDPGGRIVLFYPKTNNGFFFLLTTVFFYFKISFQRSPEYAKMQFQMRGHFNIRMTSLDDHVQYNQCI